MEDQLISKQKVLNTLVNCKSVNRCYTMIKYCSLDKIEDPAFIHEKDLIPDLKTAYEDGFKDGLNNREKIFKGGREC